MHLPINNCCMRIGNNGWPILFKKLFNADAHSRGVQENCKNSINVSSPCRIFETIFLT